jgi:6-pyruvoyltetrahydropterin/6-carboxytetrahydropterin synthase
MFEISVEETFAAGHALRGYHGKCEKVHGHNYRVQVTVEGEKLNSAGLLMDFVDLKQLLRAVIERLDHEFLNDVPPFDALNPSAENMAKYFYDEISQALAASQPGAPVRLSSVKIWETDTSTATYRL